MIVRLGRVGLGGLLIGAIGCVSGPFTYVPHMAAPQTAHTLTPDPSPRVPGEGGTVPPAISLLAPPEAVALPAQHELSVDELVRLVLERNPSLIQMTAAWQAASARYPQAVSLEDPMFGVTVGPQSFNSSTVNPAYRVEISQKYPAPGKRRLRGENALAQASAAGNDVDDMRLQLIESAKNAFYDYYMAVRALAVNDESLRLLKEFRKNAEARVRTGLAPEQDVLQATVEVGREEQRRLTLERTRLVASARINTLMHLPPDAPLAPPPATVALAEPLPEAVVLRAEAVAQRPDLQALSNRIAAEQANLALAYKDYCPDVEPFVMYDRFMGNNAESSDLAAMVGVRLNLPVRCSRRSAAIAEAQARIAERQAELARTIDQVNFQVQEAYEQVREAEQTVRLYEQSILRAGQANVKAALSAYITGKIAFVSLLGAQRDVVMLQDRLYEAIGNYHRQRATLERVLGRRYAGPQGL